MISHVLVISHILTNFESSDLPIFCVTLPPKYLMPYIFPYTVFTTYMVYTTHTAFSIWNLSTVPGVTITHDFSDISKWYQTLIECTYLLVVLTPLIRSLNSLNRFNWSILVINLPVTPFLGPHSKVTSFLFI